MTYQDLIIEIKQLSPDEQNSLLQFLIQLMQESLSQHARRTNSLARVRGMLKPEGLPPTDDELAEDYTRYLIEKYV